jgi:hypothetical protein
MFIKTTQKCLKTASEIGIIPALKLIFKIYVLIICYELPQKNDFVEVVQQINFQYKSLLFDRLFAGSTIAAGTAPSPPWMFPQRAHTRANARTQFC